MKYKEKNIEQIIMNVLMYLLGQFSFGNNGSNPATQTISNVGQLNNGTQPGDADVTSII